MPQHGLRCQTHLAEQALRAATWKVKNRLSLGRGDLRIANNGHVILVFNVQQGTRGFLGQTAWHFLVDKVNDLLFDRRRTNAGRRRFGLFARKCFEQVVCKALNFHAHTHHAGAGQFDGFGVGGVQHEHGRSIARAERFLAHFAQQIAHVHGHFAKVNFDWARREALVAHRAVIGHIFKFLPVLDGHTTACLLFVQEGFDQQGCGQNFVAGAVQQIGPRNVCGAHRFAFATAQAIFDTVGNGANVGLLHDERFVAHQTKTGGVGIGQVSMNDVAV